MNLHAAGIVRSTIRAPHAFALDGCWQLQGAVEEVAGRGERTNAFGRSVAGARTKAQACVVSSGIVSPSRWSGRRPALEECISRRVDYPLHFPYKLAPAAVLVREFRGSSKFVPLGESGVAAAVGAIPARGRVSAHDGA